MMDGAGLRTFCRLAMHSQLSLYIFDNYLTCRVVRCSQNIGPLLKHMFYGCEATATLDVGMVMIVGS